jgi:hypothetical protein
MGKAARLNRERREKTMREDRDWGTPKTTVFIKRSVFQKIESIWIDAGFSGDLVLEGVKAVLLSFAVMAITEHARLGKRILNNNPPKTIAHILRDEDNFWAIHKEEGIVKIAFRNIEYKVSIEKDMMGDGWEDDPPVSAKLLAGLLTYPESCTPSLYFYEEGQSFSESTLN